MKHELAKLSSDLQQLQQRLHQLDKQLGKRDYLIKVDDTTMLLWERNTITRWKGKGD